MYICSFSVVKAQSIHDFDSIINRNDSHTFVLGETHPSNVWYFYKHNSLIISSIQNYNKYKEYITNNLFLKKGLTQVIIEYPVYMEYNLNKYNESKDTNWLGCITYSPFIKNEAIKYIDFVLELGLEIKCIDLPRKNQLPQLKSSLINILLERNGLESASGDYQNINMDSIDLFKEELSLLFRYSNNRGIKKNSLVVDDLNDYLKNNHSAYQRILGDRLELYERILASLKSYILNLNEKGWHKDQFREGFLFNQFSAISNPYQLVIVGNGHVYNTKPLINPKKLKTYKTFIDYMEMDSIQVLLSTTYFQGIIRNDSRFELNWVKEMDLYKKIETPTCLISIFTDDIRGARIIVVIK
jgi:hypothetical protein